MINALFVQKCQLSSRVKYTRTGWRTFKQYIIRTITLIIILIIIIIIKII